MKRKILIAARIKKCGGQQVLADMLGVSRTEVSYWENAHKRPHPHYQLELCRILGFDDPAVLLEIDYTDEEANESTAPTAEFLLQAVVSDSDTPEEENDESLTVSFEKSLLSNQNDLTEEADESRTLTAELFPSSDQKDSPSENPIVFSIPDAVQRFIASGLERRLCHIAHTNYSSSSQMTSALRQAIEEFNAMNDPITRREAICEAMWSLAALPMTVLGKNPTLHTRHYDEMLRHCTAALEGCWQLYRDSNSAADRHALDCTCTYVPLLETIARYSSHHHKEALELAAQYAILQTMLSWKCKKRFESIGYAQHALSLSEATGNILLLLSAYSKLGYTYLTDKQYAMAWETMQGGEHVLKDYQRKRSGPLLLSGIIGNFYSGYSQAQIHNGVDPDTALGIATESQPLSEPIAFTEFTASSQWWEAAWVCSTKGDPKQAMRWLKKLIDPETLAPLPSLSQSQYEQIETLNVFTRASLQLQGRDMEKIIQAWTAAMEWTRVHKRDVLYQEAMTNFEIMKALYPGERAILKLSPLTAHW